ncbi:MAG TPA: FAD-dependent oxidoreductase [Candidatus Eisenbacteria bacterium]|nr:FAD-dependent oxidoreductase [Candidatus Eisenbacteria bacterium]
MLRHEAAEARIASGEFDVCIIGGGATGAGCALDAQLRGLKTVLLEGNDFASGTSSTSTKLIHGGVRYLEQAVKGLDVAEYRVVKRALQERIRMLNNGPFLSRPMEFIVPCYDWLTVGYMGIGLKMYDWLAGAARIFESRYQNRETTMQHLPSLKGDRLVGSVVYADGQFDDGRYNLGLVKTMGEAGGDALNHARVVSFGFEANRKLREVEVENTLTGGRFRVRARVFVNATGPWADTIRQMANPDAHPRMRVSKGIHILLPLELLRSKSALLIPKTEDGRVLFAVPWFDRMLVGTTETEVSIHEEMGVTRDEIAYVLRHLNHYLATPVTPDQILSGSAGMRPLVSASGAKATSKLARDHEVELDAKSGLVSIMGGKWTTYRAMAEDTIDEVQKQLGMSVTPTKTIEHRLAGSEGYSSEYAKTLVGKSLISESTAQHMIRKFGTRAVQVMELARQEAELGQPIVAGLTPLRAEIVYCIREEMAMTVEDVLSRRTGLQLLDWRAAREAASVAGAYLARELGWSRDTKRSSVDAYRQKITRMLEMAGLPDEQGAPKSDSRNHHA